jgi:hypothetical protein
LINSPRCPNYCLIDIANYPTPTIQAILITRYTKYRLGAETCFWTHPKSQLIAGIFSDFAKIMLQTRIMSLVSFIKFDHKMYGNINHLKLPIGL